MNHYFSGICNVSIVTWGLRYFFVRQELAEASGFRRLRQDAMLCMPVSNFKASSWAQVMLQFLGGWAAVSDCFPL